MACRFPAPFCGAGAIAASLPIAADAKPVRHIFHPLKAFDESGIPLGTVWQKTWARESLHSHLSKSERSRKRSQTPIDEKESIRWIEGIRKSREVAQVCPETTCVCVGDSEFDIYKTFIEPRNFTTSTGEHGQLHLIVRARQARATNECGDWFELLRRQECIYESTVDVSPCGPQKIAPSKARERNLPRTARIAALEVRAKSVTLRPPYRFNEKLNPAEINRQAKRSASSTAPPNEVVRMVAGLGGYVDRKKTQPGTQTLWIG